MILNERSDEVRLIESFPKWYENFYTPHISTDFNDITKQICQNYCKSNDTNRVFKIIVLGDVSVGKTCIVNRFCHQIFNSNYKATIGVDFEIELFKILGVLSTLQIWDTAGQERFKCIAQSYYRSAHAIVLVFELTNSISLSNCETWLREALNAGNGKDSLIFLVGNKKDLLMDSFAYESATKLGNETAQKLQAEYWTVSAQSGENIEQLFCRIMALVFDTVLQKDKSLLNCRPRDVLLGTNLVSFKEHYRNKKKRSKNCGNCNNF